MGDLDRVGGRDTVVAGGEGQRCVFKAADRVYRGANQGDGLGGRIAQVTRAIAIVQNQLQCAYRRHRIAAHIGVAQGVDQLVHVVFVGCAVEGDHHAAIGIAGDGANVQGIACSQAEGVFGGNAARDGDGQCSAIEVDGIAVAHGDRAERIDQRGHVVGAPVGHVAIEVLDDRYGIHIGHVDRVGVAGGAVALAVADLEAEAGVAAAAFAVDGHELEFARGDVFVADALAHRHVGPGAAVGAVLQRAFGGQAGDDHALQACCLVCAVGIGKREIGCRENMRRVFIDRDAAIGTRRNLVVQHRGCELPRVAGDATYAANVAVDAVGLRGGHQDHAHLRGDGVTRQPALGVGKVDKCVGIELEADEAVGLAVGIQVSSGGFEVHHLPCCQHGGSHIEGCGAGRNVQPTTGFIEPHFR